MYTATANHATPMMPLSSKDWEALDSLFEELETEPSEQSDTLLPTDSESVVLVSPLEENGWLL